MPSFAYNIPAEECNVGGALSAVKGSVCYGCYAKKGRYLFQNVQTAMYARLEAFQNHPRWVEAMSFMIQKRCAAEPYFRWFDSGDLQSVEMLQKIVQVCINTPDITHWLPTREKAVILQFVKEGGVVPDNLTIRLSAPMVDKKAGMCKVTGCTSSTVSTEGAVFPEAYHCPSRHQNNKCGDCRACWDRSVDWVDYHKH
jgi:hypothetical protein